MSAVLTVPEQEELQRHRERLAAERAEVVVVRAPKPAVRARRSVRRERPFPWVGAVFSYAALGLMVYLASSLAGQTLTEEARRRATLAEDRAASARKEVALLRTQVDRLTDIRAVEQWAMRRGFVADVPSNLAQAEESVHVASLR